MNRFIFVRFSQVQKLHSCTKKHAYKNTHISAHELQKQSQNAGMLVSSRLTNHQPFVSVVSGS